MAIINFSIPKTLEQRINATIKEKGFASKAEFFRFAAMFFIDSSISNKINEDERFNFLTQSLSKAISKKYKDSPIDFLQEQLNDI